MLLIGIWLAASVLLILLHRLDRLLMQERTTWRATVRSAWLGVLDLRGSATKGQWWGYAAFTGLAALSCLLVLPIAAPFVTLLLLVPLPALLWRRFRGLTNEEAWAIVALIVLVWLSWRYDF